MYKKPALVSNLMSPVIKLVDCHTLRSAHPDRFEKMSTTKSKFEKFVPSDVAICGSIVSPNACY